jgi:hypothetical protein
MTPPSSALFVITDLIRHCKIFHLSGKPFQQLRTFMMETEQVSETLINSTLTPMITLENFGAFISLEISLSCVTE